MKLRYGLCSVGLIHLQVYMHQVGRFRLQSLQRYRKFCRVTSSHPSVRFTSMFMRLLMFRFENIKKEHKIITTFLSNLSVVNDIVQSSFKQTLLCFWFLVNDPVVFVQRLFVLVSGFYFFIFSERFNCFLL